MSPPTTDPLIATFNDIYMWIVEDSNTNLPAELMASLIEPKSKTPPVVYDTLQIIVINIDKLY